MHEKAILMVTVPLAIFAAVAGDAASARQYAFLNTVGTYSLFPLLFRPQEYLIKVRQWTWLTPAG